MCMLGAQSQSSFCRGRLKSPMLHTHAPVLVRPPRQVVQVSAKKGNSHNSRFAGKLTPRLVEPPVPAVDPDNAEFVVFVRPHKAAGDDERLNGQNSWLPVCIMKGTPALNLLARGLELKWGRTLLFNFIMRLITSIIAIGLYKDLDKIEGSLRQNVPNLRKAPEGLDYAFKIRDKSNPESWQDTKGVTALPRDKEVISVRDMFINMFSVESISKLIKRS